MSMIKPQLSINFSQVLVAHTFNPSTQEAEAGGTLLGPGNSSLHELITWQTIKILRNPVTKQKHQANKQSKELVLERKGFSALRFSMT